MSLSFTEKVDWKSCCSSIRAVAWWRANCLSQRRMEAQFQSSVELIIFYIARDCQLFSDWRKTYRIPALALASLRSQCYVHPTCVANDWSVEAFLQGYGWSRDAWVHHSRQTYPRHSCASVNKSSVLPNQILRSCQGISLQCNLWDATPSLAYSENAHWKGASWRSSRTKGFLQTTYLLSTKSVSVYFCHKVTYFSVGEVVHDLFRGRVK